MGGKGVRCRTAGEEEARQETGGRVEEFWLREA